MAVLRPTLMLTEGFPGTKRGWGWGGNFVSIVMDEWALSISQKNQHWVIAMYIWAQAQEVKGGSVEEELLVNLGLRLVRRESSQP